MLFRSSGRPRSRCPLSCSRCRRNLQRSGQLSQKFVLREGLGNQRVMPEAAWELVAGDRLSSHDGRWLAVEEVFDTGEYATVYNLRVSEYHTYFVGTPAWGFSVWAHNSNVCQVIPRLYFPQTRETFSPYIGRKKGSAEGGTEPWMARGGGQRPTP